MDLNLTGRVALVTGGSKGIGRGVALTLAGEGVDVALCARGAEDLEKTAQEIRTTTGRRCLAVPGDLTLLEDCQRFVKTSVDHFGRADILVHCAGSPGRSPGTLSALPDDEWLQLMNLKFFAAVRCCREVVPHMQKNRWGRIVLIAGMTARVVRLQRMDNGPVNVSLASFGKQLSAQVIGDGIRVNTVHPDATLTPMRSAEMEAMSRRRGTPVAELEKEMLATLPMHRFILPEEVASLVAFLCSDLADAITGQSIGIDGGSATGVHY